jgi:hypothetical protein
MLGNKATFSCTALQGTNKSGKLKPDTEGYYEVVLGALNFFNSAGVLYTYEGTAKEIFKASSSFMRRVAKGALRGEYGHPRRENMNTNQYVIRLLEVYEDKVSHHIKEVRVDYTAVKDERGNPCIAIIGKIKPSGPYGPTLQASLDNPGENVCFSIRAVTADETDKARGYQKKEIQQIVTWDYVNEPGLSVANKFKSPSLESFEDVDVTVTRGIMRSILKVKEEEQREELVTMESSQAVVLMNEAMVNLGWSKKKPAYTRW